jgi:hypothetical protein
MVDKLIPPSGRISRRSRGAVMVITLIAVILLAGMVFYIINLGRQANARIVAQHSADAAAAAGAGWIARSFNTVAMNNVSTARSIVTVAALDAMPMAMQFTHEDQLAALDALNSQLQRGVNDGWVRDAFLVLRDELEREIQLLAPLDRFFNVDYDVTEMTFYNGPAGRGTLWRAMEAMDEFSQITMENIGPLAQLNAIRGGEVNLERDTHTADEQSMALMVPIFPQFAWRRGEFDDFERPVRQGLLPTDVDDKTTNRGPFDTVFGWRFGRPRSVQGYSEAGGDDEAQAPGGGRPRVPFGSGPGSSGGNRFIVTEVEWENYGVYGPLEWMFSRFGDFAWNNLFHSRFSRWVREITNIKISYCWPGDPIKTVIDPEWITDYEQANSIAEAGTPVIHTTAFFRCEIKSAYPRGHSNFLSPGTWTYRYGRQNPDRHPATIVRAGGWHDARTWGVTKIGNHIWRDEWSYNVYFDNEIGLPPMTNPDGSQVVHVVYRIDEYAFLGIDVGEPVEVRNPFNYTSKTDLPAPIDFDHSQVRSDDDSRREKLTYLAAAQRSNRSLFWPTRFDAGKPYPHTVGITQVAVFNTHSWDLWTQMWHAQIERVERYDDWVARLPDYASDAALMPQLDAQRVDDLFGYLKSIEPLADVMLMH